MTGVKESSLRLHLDHFDELDSGRAVFGQADLSTTFSFGHWCRKGQSEAKEADQKAAFRGMRDLATVVKLGNSKGHGRYKCCFMWCPCQHLLGSAPHSLESLNMEGLFVTQVRGGMNDSAVLGFKVDQKRFEVSFEWRKILSHYFEEQRITDDKFGIVAVSMRSSHVSESSVANPIQDEDLREATIVRSKRLPQWYSDMNDQDPLGFELDRDVANQQSIESIVKEDKDKEFQLDHELRELLDRRRLWENPASTWRSEMQYVTGKARLTAEKAKLKRDADLEINLNDEGVVKDEQ